MGGRLGGLQVRGEPAKVPGAARLRQLQSECGGLDGRIGAVFERQLQKLCQILLEPPGVSELQQRLFRRKIGLLQSLQRLGCVHAQGPSIRRVGQL